MYFIYSLLLAVGFLLLLPRFLFDAARHGKYAVGFRQRTGRLPTVRSRAPVIWLHCVSVGETQAARPLASALLSEFPSHTLVVSTTTRTGQKVAREAFGQTAALVFYFPFDWAWSVRRALRAVNPAVVLVMETELWPRFFRECRARGVPVALVNGRLSEKSFRRYRIVRNFIRRVLSDLSLAVMQTPEDAGRVRALGLAAERIKISGNVKFDAEPSPGETALTDELRARFSFDNRRPLLVAASTHAPEERVLLEAFKVLCETDATQRPRLLIAPRHPERFEEVASLLQASALAWARRSSAPLETDARAEVILLDSIGELRGVYPLAEIVFVGGSIARTGGHNVLEPASAARCIVTGAHTWNFTAVVRAMRERDALVQLPDVAEEEAAGMLAGVFANYLADDERRRALGERARAALEENRGATARTVETLAPLLRPQQQKRGGHTLTEPQRLPSLF